MTDDEEDEDSQQVLQELENIDDEVDMFGKLTHSLRLVNL